MPFSRRRSARQRHHHQGYTQLRARGHQHSSDAPDHSDHSHQQHGKNRGHQQHEAKAATTTLGRFTRRPHAHQEPTQSVQPSPLRLQPEMSQTRPLTATTREALTQELLHTPTMHDNNHAATTQASLVQTPTQAQASALPATAATEELYLGLKFTTFIPIAAISASGLFCVVVLMAWCTSIGTKKRKKRQDKEHARQAAVIRGSDPDELEKPLSGRSDSSLPASDGDYSFPQRNYEGCDYYTGHQNVHVRVKSEPDHQARSAALQSAPPPRPKTRAHTKGMSRSINDNDKPAGLRRNLSRRVKSVWSGIYDYYGSSHSHIASGTQAFEMRSQAVRPMSQNCFVIGPDERDEIGMDESQDATSYFAGEAYRWSYPKDQHLPQPPLSPGAVSLGSPSIMSDDGTGMTPLLPQSRPSFSSLRDHQTYGTCRERATGLGLYISDDDAVASGALRLRQPHTEPGSPTVVDISPTTMSSGAGGGLELPTDQQGGSHLSSSQASRSFNDSAMAASVRLSSSHSKGVSVVDPNVPVIRTVHTAD